MGAIELRKFTEKKISFLRRSAHMYVERLSLKVIFLMFDTADLVVHPVDNVLLFDQILAICMYIYVHKY